MNPLLVSIVQDSQPGRYPAVPPFSPTLNFPEYPFGENALESGHDPAAGRTYEMVRQVLFQLQMDLENYGTRSWNPLGELIHPGDTVLLKPNIVCDRHGWGWDIQSVITHGSVVRAILNNVSK